MSLFSSFKNHLKRIAKAISNINNITILDVPYIEKDIVKALGAKWNPAIRKWYIPSWHRNPESLSEWLPRDNMDNPTQEQLPQDNANNFSQEFLPQDSTDNLAQEFLPPFHIAESSSECWRCQKTSPVFCFTASGFTDTDYCEDSEEMVSDTVHSFIVLSNLTYLPDDFIKSISKLTQHYFKDFSRTANLSYYMNHCHNCNAKLGDYYLSQPGDAFSPIDIDDAASITIHKLNITIPLLTNGDFASPAIDFAPPINASSPPCETW